VATDSIVITGASSGIGRHAALAMNAIGFKVFAGLRKMKDFDSLQKVAVYPDRLIPLLLDVTSDVQMAEAVKVVEKEVGEAGLTAIYGNAGTGLDSKQSSAAEFTSIDDWKWLFDVNFFGNVRLVQAFLPLLRKNKNGKIIFNTSLAGLMSPAFIASYGSSKYAVQGLADSLRVEVREFNIDVIVIAPGFVFSKLLGRSTETAVNKMKNLQSIYTKESKTRLGFVDGLKTTESPKVTSDALVDAVLNVRPKFLYVVGGMSGVVNVIRHFPTKVLMLLMDYAPEPEGLTKEEWATVATNCDAELFKADDYKKH